MTRVETAPTRTFRRRAEAWIAGIGLTAAAVLQGGFVLTVTRSDDETLRQTIVPALRSAGIDVPADRAHELLNTLAAWFGFSLLATMALCAVGFYIAARRPERRAAGWWFLAAGLVCLFGTQLILYPVAFLFFVTAGLFAVRTPHPRSTT